MNILIFTHIHRGANENIGFIGLVHAVVLAEDAHDLGALDGVAAVVLKPDPEGQHRGREPPAPVALERSSRQIAAAVRRARFANSVAEHTTERQG